MSITLVQQIEASQSELLAQQLELLETQVETKPRVKQSCRQPAARTADPGFRGASSPENCLPNSAKKSKKAGPRRARNFVHRVARAFKALVHRYIGQSDLIVASPMAGRTQVETENPVGFFVNTVLLRTDLSENPTFSALVKRVAIRFLAHMPIRDVPLEILVRELQPERFARSPSVHATNVPGSARFSRTIAMGRSQLEFLDAATDTAKCDLTVDVAQTASGPVVRAEYNTDLFDEAMISQFAWPLREHPQSGRGSPRPADMRLAILSQGEEQQLVQEWNNTQSDYPRENAFTRFLRETAGRNRKPSLSNSAHADLLIANLMSAAISSVIFARAGGDQGCAGGALSTALPGNGW
jgi:hypothetical protein